jgi:YD repeat-containing protein
VYDFENHLLQAGGITYTYDGDGNRVKKVAAGATARYTVVSRNPTG